MIGVTPSLLAHASRPLPRVLFVGILTLTKEQHILAVVHAHENGFLAMTGILRHLSRLDRIRELDGRMEIDEVMILFDVAVMGGIDFLPCRQIR